MTRHKFIRNAVSVISAFLLGACLVVESIAYANTTHAEPANLVFSNGRIATMDLHQPEAQALAVKNHRIVAVGSNATIKRYIGQNTKVIRLHGMFVTPGFIDSHAHFLNLGEALGELNLRSDHAPTWSGVVSLVAQAVKRAKPGQWIVGHGWHQERWSHPPHPNVDGLPTGKKLDAASPNNPVLLVHSSGHAVFVNKKAMELAGITKNTPSPPGGTIVRDKSGRAIGMLRDNAQTFVFKVLKKHRANRTPAEVYAQRLQKAERATRNALKHGVTTFQDMGQPFDGIDFFKKIARQGKLHIRLYAWINAEPVKALAKHLSDYYLVDYGQHAHLTVRGVGEILSDGALGSHSAWFFKPYDDEPSTSGLNVTPLKKIKAMAEVAIQDGFQMSVHAIGTRANHETLNAYQEVMAEHPAKTDLRWRIDHAQHLIPSDIPRFHRLHVIASMQTGHACNDAPYVIKRIGKARAAYSYAWHSLIEDRAIIANGTDAPVIPIDTIPNYYCAVTRKEGFDPSRKAFFAFQRMTRRQALRSYTYNGAYSMFKEAELGSLAPGKLADITVFDQNLLTAPANRLRKTKVVYTILGGKVLYHKGEGVIGLKSHDE